MQRPVDDVEIVHVRKCFARQVLSAQITAVVVIVMKVQVEDAAIVVEVVVVIVMKV